jgi:TonB family protein
MQGRLRRRSSYVRVILLAPSLLAFDVSGLARQEAQLGVPAQPVCGRVVAVDCPYNLPHTTLVYLGGAEQLRTVFPIAIRQADRVKFRQSPEDLYQPGSEVCATGTIDWNNGLPWMVVTAPEHLQIRKAAPAAQPAWRGEHFFTCDEAVEMPTRIHDVKPSYTREALRLGKHGVVVIQALVRADGRVGDVHVVKSLDATTGLDEEAVRAVKAWRFQPGTRFGKPAPIIINIEVSFSVGEK